MKTCKGCGAEIRWITTEAGKAMPLDAKPVNFYIQSGETWKMTQGYIVHWATCPNAKDFKRKKRRWKSIQAPKS